VPPLLPPRSILHLERRTLLRMLLPALIPLGLLITK